MRKKALWTLGLAVLGLLLGACAQNAGQDTLDPVGDVAKQQKALFVPVFWVATVVFVIVQGGIIYIALRFRHRKGQERMPRQTHGNTRLEIGWTIVPTVVLAVVMVPAISLLWELARPPEAGALNITVQGFQWWWGFSYPDGDMATDWDTPITIADTMIVPTDRDVYLSLEAMGGAAKDDDGSPDHEVIHSFWVPQLFGKQDVVPNRTNHIQFSVDEPGLYTGQCAEFCGLQHGRMKLEVVALAPDDWDAWVENQRTLPPSPTDPLAERGEEIFLNPLSDGRGSCTACHTVGDNPGGAAAPNLSHFADEQHTCFAGCNWPVSDREALAAWLADPSAEKLGAKMPDYQLTDEEIQALVAYLYSLT
ncbi:MAG: cytochrome c oxidase subunit II [Actinomycetota bacterium]